MNFKTLEEHITQFPIYQYTFLNIEDIEFNDKVRTVCKKSCSHYGKSWSCPPAIGTLKQCKCKCMDYAHALLFSSVSEIPNHSKKEVLLQSKQEHEEITAKIEDYLRSEALKCFTLSTESCTLCEKCTYPKKSCLQPDRMHPCIESHGIWLTKNLEENHMDYYAGDHTVLWFSLIFIKEA